MDHALHRLLELSYSYEIFIWCLWPLGIKGSENVTLFLSYFSSVPFSAFFCFSLLCGT